MTLALAGAVPIPPECQPPPAHDVSGLKALAERSGALSVGLDSVATWCFDSGGAWTGGVKPTRKQPKPPPAEEPVGECAKAIGACEGAKVAVAAELRQQLTDTLAELQRPFLGRKYTPKRSGLDDRPNEAANCQSRTRSELYTQAQSRMDLARLASVAQNEHASYRTWLYAESLKCAQTVAKRRNDPLRKGIAVAGAVGSEDQGEQVIPGESGKGAGSTGAGATGGPRAGSATDAGGTLASSGAGATTGGAGGTSAVVVGTTGTTAVGAPPPGAADAGAATGAAPGPSTGTAAVTTAGASGPSTAMGATAPGAGTVGPVAAPGGASDRAAGGGASSTAGGQAPVGGARAAGAGGSSPAGAQAAVPGTLVASASTEVSVGGPTADRERALASPMLEKWRYLVAQRAKCELDRDYMLGFLPSRELRDCHCPRLHPSEVVRRLETNENLAALQADDERNTRCELCLLDAFAAWRTRATKQCALIEKLSEYEVGVLERSDDGNGLPPRCFASIRALRPDAGRPAPTGAGPTAPTGAGPTAPTRAGPTVPAITVTKHDPPPGVVTSAIADTFVRAADYAPVPMREDGRLYVRIFMSSACVADVTPGPMQVRTGDLVVIPYGAKMLMVKSPCGGLAEVYWGREPKPRVSEIFGRNQPLQLQFKPQ